MTSMNTAAARIETAPVATVSPLDIPWHVADAAVRRAKANGRPAPAFYLQVLEAWKEENERIGKAEDAKRAAANAPRPMVATDFIPKSVRQRPRGDGRNIGGGLSRFRAK